MHQSFGLCNLYSIYSIWLQSWKSFRCHNSFFSFHFLFQFCGFKIIAKINKFYIFKKFNQNLFLVGWKKKFEKKIDGHREGFSISIVWLWTSRYPQEDLAKFLVQMGEKSRKNLLRLWTCKILLSKYDHIKKTFLEISPHWGTFSRTCCSTPFLLSQARYNILVILQRRLEMLESTAKHRSDGLVNGE